VLVAKAQKTAEAHDCINDPARDLVDHQVVNLAYALALPVKYIGAFHIFAGNEGMIGMCCIHFDTPYNALQKIFRGAR